MARRSFFGRIVDRVRQVFTPAPPAEPEPPRRRAPGGTIEDRSEREYRSEWRSQHAPGDFEKHYRVFHRMIDPIEDDPDERAMLWESYIKYMVKGEGRHRRNSSNNQWWHDSGLDPDDWSWARWRDAMGYTGKNRSRTS